MSDNARKIKPVNDNKDKQRTYKENCEKYNKALKEGFYFEAMLIDYAMMEDRLRSFLYYIGALASRKSVRVSCAKTQNQLKNIVASYKEEKEKDDMGISNISGKMKIIEATMKWSLSDGDEEDPYLQILKSEYKRVLNAHEVLEVLQKIKNWCSYRNEVIHALLNKNMDSLNKELESQVKEGMHLAKTVDKYVSALKRKNNIRKSMGLSVEK